MRFKEFSEAVGDHYLYHGTSPRNASKILYMNLLVGRTKQMFAGWRGRFKEKDIDTTRGEDAVLWACLCHEAYTLLKNGLPAAVLGQWPISKVSRVLYSL